MGDLCDALKNWKKSNSEQRFQEVKRLIQQYAREHNLRDVNVVRQPPPDIRNTARDESQFKGAYNPDTRTVYLHPGLFTDNDEGSTPDSAFETAGHEMVHVEARDTFPGDPWLDSDAGDSIMEKAADDFGDAVGKDIKEGCKRRPPPPSPAADDSLGDDDFGDDDDGGSGGGARDGGTLSAGGGRDGGQP